MCGEIGLSIKQFDALTWRQLDNITKGYFKRLDREAQQSWEQTRWLMYVGLLPHQKKGSQLTLQNVLPFSWDNQNEESEKQVATAEDIKDVIDFWEKQDKVKGVVEQ